jgi:cardiolipin synthase
MTYRFASLLAVACLLVAGCSVTSERRVHKPVQTEHAVTDPEFGKTMSHLLGPPLLEGNTVVTLENGDEIFPAMLEAIRGAKRTITIEQYIWSPGKVSSEFVEALTERARAGVKIHIVVDGIGSMKLGTDDLKPLLDAGAEFGRFNTPGWFRLFKVNHRTHRKLMVIDGKVGFTGGVCMSDEWLGDGETNPEHWREVHFRIEGPVVAQMQAAFMDNWIETRSELLDGPEYYGDSQRAGEVTAQCFKSGPTDGAENARLSYLLLIAGARKSIRLAHSYFVPDAAAVNALLEARGRDVRIEVIVPAKSDAAVVGQASRSRWGKLLEAGVEFYEYQPSLYHPKIMIVDDAWVTTGSVNFDERSFGMNDEANLNVLDKEFAAHLIKILEEDKNKSWRLTAQDFKRRPWLVRCWDSFAGLFHRQL